MPSYSKKQGISGVCKVPCFIVIQCSALRSKALFGQVIFGLDVTKFDIKLIKVMNFFFNIKSENVLFE